MIYRWTSGGAGWRNSSVWPDLATWLGMHRSRLPRRGSLSGSPDGTFEPSMSCSRQFALPLVVERGGRPRDVDDISARPFLNPQPVARIARSGRGREWLLSVAFPPTMHDPPLLCFLTTTTNLRLMNSALRPCVAHPQPPRCVFDFPSGGNRTAASLRSARGCLYIHRRRRPRPSGHLRAHHIFSADSAHQSACAPAAALQLPASTPLLACRARLGMRHCTQSWRFAFDADG